MRARLVLAVLGAVLLPLGVITAAPAMAVATVQIGNNHQQINGTYLNAQVLAQDLAFTGITVQAATSITISDPVDLSTAASGTPQFDLTLSAPVCNISNQLNFSQLGRLLLTCGTINWNAPITSGGALMTATRIVSTATQAIVQSNAADIQQAIDDSSPSSPVTVSIAAGQYAENLTVNHSVQLTGDDGSGPSGAGPDAPDIAGNQAGGSIITATADDVSIDGLHLSGVVSTGPTTRSLSGVSAPGLDTISVSHNTFDGFAGPAVQTDGSTNVDVSANDITPTLLSTTVMPSDPEITTGTDQQLTDTGTDSEGASTDLTNTASWSTSDDTVATVDATGLVHGVGEGTATITATVGDLSATTDVQVGPASTQTIQFTSTPPAPATVGGSYLVGAAASSGLPVSVTIDASSTTGACTLTDATVSFTGVGTCVVDADQAGDASHQAAARQSQTIAVGPGAQTISFTSVPPAGPAVGTTYGVAATATSGLPVSFSIGSNSTAKACKRTGSTITFTGAGTCVINANQAGDASYLAAPRAQQILTVGAVSQAPAFLPTHPATTAYAGATYLSTFAASGGPAPSFALASGAPAWLSVDPSSGVVSGVPPTGPSSFTYSVVVDNGVGQATSAPVTVAVSALPKTALRANIWLTLVCPAKAKITVTITCTTVVSNLGPATATNLHAVIVLPASITPITPSAGASVVGRDITWSGASLASGASVTFSVTARATLAGTFTTTDAAWSDTADAKPANNVKTKAETFTGP